MRWAMKSCATLPVVTAFSMAMMTPRAPSTAAAFVVPSSFKKIPSESHPLGIGGRRHASCRSP